VSADGEILRIDAMEDDLVPLADGVAAVRELISTLELCHHKAGRWVDNILEGIGAGGSSKGLGTREPGRLHDAERVWQAACDALSAWCAGCPAQSLDGDVGTAAASRLAARLGDRTPLKEWQVQRVVEKIRSLIHWPPTTDDPSADFTWLLFSDTETELTYRGDCPVRFAEHEEFWRTTARTIIRDTQDGHEAPISLALAIDMLWPCHWDFVGSLETVLGAIGGDLEPDRPFAACARNIGLLPDRERYELVSRTLRVFCGESEPNSDADPDVLAVVGAPTPEKTWLAASLDKTIRLQLDPPDELRKVVAFPGPSWIHDPEPR
jgi:hypothetical protein